jgi:hypothetical protein
MDIAGLGYNIAAFEVVLGVLFTLFLCIVAGFA